MYQFTKRVELSDDAVHRHSLLEWEELMLKAGDIERDDLPISYGKVAEVICWALARYGHHWATDADLPEQAKMSDAMLYIDRNGYTINPRIPRVSNEGDEANQSLTLPMQIGSTK